MTPHRHTGVVIDYSDKSFFPSAGSSIDSMSVFNPRMLDASIRDVVESLSDKDKTSVLLYAMERLPMSPESRTVIENGVQSCLQVSSMLQEKVIQARLLRAKGRFSAGLRDAAHQDLQAILQLNPNHRETRELLPPAGGTISTRIGHCRMPALTRVSNEIWSEIASFLQRRDLRNLLLVPHVLSSIASRLLFRDVCLQFGTAQSDDGQSAASEEIDKWHAQRNADILIRLVSDTEYAGLVKSLSVRVREDGSGSNMNSFQIAILANVLPKLTTLKVFRCHLDSDAFKWLLGVLEKSHPKLQGLVIQSDFLLPALPALHYLNRFVYSGALHRALEDDFDAFLSSQTVALHTLVIDLAHPYPASFLPAVHLRNLYLTLTIYNADFLSQILENGRQLEVLRLEVDHGCVLSTVFRAHAGPHLLPSLRKLSFVLTGAKSNFTDPDLFPAVAKFVRGFRMLEALCLSNTHFLAGFGYDAAIWGVLPSLVNLRTLLIDLPKDLPPALSAWLIPRSVTVLHLHVTRHATVDISQLWPGLPGGLKFLAFPVSPDDIQNLLRSGLPGLRVVQLLESDLYTIHGRENERELEHWPDRRRRYYFDDYLEQLDLGELRFLYPKLSWVW